MKKVLLVLIALVMIVVDCEDASAKNNLLEELINVVGKTSTSGDFESVRERRTLLNFFVDLLIDLLLCFLFLLFIQDIERFDECESRCQHCAELSAVIGELFCRELMKSVCRFGRSFLVAGAEKAPFHGSFPKSHLHPQPSFERS